MERGSILEELLPGEGKIDTVLKGKGDQANVSACIPEHETNEKVLHMQKI